MRRPDGVTVRGCRLFLGGSLAILLATGAIAQPVPANSEITYDEDRPRDRERPGKASRGWSHQIWVEIDEGAFSLFGTASPREQSQDAQRREADGLETPGAEAQWADAGFVALFVQFPAGQLFVYESLVRKAGDVAQALRALERDFGIDPWPLAELDDDLRRALASGGRELLGAESWRPASVLTIGRRLGFQASSQTAIMEPLYCPPGSPCPAWAPLADGPTDGDGDYANGPRDRNELAPVVRGDWPISRLQGAVSPIVEYACCCGCNRGGRRPLRRCTGPCDDGYACTRDYCNEFSCGYEQISGPFCATWLPCWEVYCDEGACNNFVRVPVGTPCHDDGDPCTEDVCSDIACTHVPINCDDGLFCNGPDACQNGSCVSGPRPCPNGCDEATDTCVECSNDGHCNDGIGCTRDLCVNNSCTFELLPCPPPPPCRGTGHCSPQYGCVYPYLCNDGDPCTSDFCNGSGQCDSTVSCPSISTQCQCATHGCDISLALPALVPVNDDDDDGDGTKDATQESLADNEDDFVVVDFDTSGCPPASAAGGNPSCGNWPNNPSRWFIYPHGQGCAPHNFAFYRNMPGGPEVITGCTLTEATEWPPPGSLMLLGINPTNQCGWDADLVLSSGLSASGPCKCTYRTDAIKVGRVVSLEWAKADPDNRDIDLCPNNGGDRIFPDKLSPTDSWPILRRHVKLVATIAPPVAGVTVYFRIFDVDDPFDQLHGLNAANASDILPGVNIIDNDDDGVDNRPNGESSFARTATTDVQGQAFTTIMISMQPGNNYRAAASLLLDAVQEQIDQGEADALSVSTDAQGKYIKNGGFTGYKVPAVWSPMLTIWRTLHVERDVMQPPVAVDLQVIAQINAVYPTPGVPGKTTVEIACPQSGSVDENNYEGGEIVFTGCPTGADTFTIRENHPCNELSPYTIMIDGTPGVCASVGSSCVFYDDDDLDVLGTASLPHFPDGGWLLPTAFRPAYILPSHAPSSFQTVVPFEDYLDYWELLTGLGSWDNYYDLSPSTSEFWSCHVVGAWEGSDDRFEVNRNGDGDPDSCGNPPVSDAESPLFGARQLGTNQVAIFLQAIKDESQCGDFTDEMHTIVHEIGHTGGLAHEKKLNSIMNVSAPKDQDYFTAQELNILRSQDPW